VTKLPVAGDDGYRVLPPGFDTSVAHPARVYDYWLSGKDNFTADRIVAQEVITVRPTILLDIRANRAFLGRAVRFQAPKPGYGSSSTSAPVFRPARTSMRSRSRQRLSAKSCMSTTTPSHFRVLARC